MVMLSPNFSLSEMTLSQTAVRREIPNEPTEEVIANLRAICMNILEPLRERLSKPILITSGYRSPMLNQAIGGARNSYHTLGKAADFHVNGMSVEELYQFIKNSDIPVDQCINEFQKWVHCSYNEGHNRGEFLRATRAEDGHTVFVHD